MRVAIISNLSAGIGLARDYALLREYLIELNHEVFGFQYDEPKPPEFSTKLDLAIFLEVLPRNLLNLAPVNWLFANAEWCKPEVIKLAERHVDKVFAKTHEAKRIFDEAFPGKTHYVGFLTRDQYDPTVPRTNRFLHVGGNSTIRGTQAVIDAFRWKKDGKYLDAELIVVGTAAKNTAGLPESAKITFLDYISEEELKQLQNSCAFHILPSGTEGFGHALHESLSVGAWLITTDAAPMNEIENAFLIPTYGSYRYNLADVYEVSALDVHKAMRRVSEHQVETSSLLAREEFLQGNESFKRLFAEHLTDATPKKIVRPPRKKTDGLRIAFMGNFHNAESTENMVLWALEALGHEVEKISEKEATLEMLQEAMDFNDLFLWVRTPTWLQVTDADMLEFLADLKRRKIPSCSVHLDKFWDIPEREKLIGVHPFFKTQFVCTADGSRQEDFKARGVNHFWMKPAMSEIYCHVGRPLEEYKCDVGFVGAGAGYHDNYPFRQKLLAFLKETYGERFKHIEGVRGHLLNDVYASIRVTVGDCFAAGTPRYFSDRAPETTGRGGLLLHPIVEGMEIPCPAYAPQDLESLKHQIDWWLAEPEETHRVVRENCMNYVRRFHTWNVRMKEVLGTVMK